MLKQKLKFKKVCYSRAGWLGVLVLVVAGMSGGLVAHADQFDQQIRLLESQNATKENSLYNLQIQASSYQDAINKLQSKIDSLEGLILSNQAKQTALEQKIKDVQAQIDHQKVVLGETIKTMYLEGQTSTLEVLLSSNNLSDFVNQEQYHLTVESNLKALVDKITALKQQLKAQNDQLTGLLNDQKAQRATLDSARSEQDSLLGYNESKQASFNRQIQANNSQIATLEARQAAANTQFLGAVGSGPNCGGSYPAQWCQIPKDSVGDNWGMFNRECVSYTAFRVFAAGGYMPYWGGVGNANQWPGDARAYGFPVTSTPRQGDIEVAIWVFASANGHAMFVDYVNSDGSVVVSDYNYNGTGQYGAPRTISQSRYQSLGFQFIHFPHR